MSCNKLINCSNFLINKSLLKKHSRHVCTNFNHKILVPSSFSAVIRCKYSTTLCGGKVLHPHLLRRNLPVLRASAVYLSTEVQNEEFKIIVTNPSGSSTTTEAASSTSTQVLQDASSTVSDIGTTSLSDTALSLTGELQSVAAHAIEPSITTLGLGNYTPVGAVQLMLEHMHIAWEMPWWAAIVGTTLVVRILMIPILIKTQRSAIYMGNHMPQLQFLQAKFGEARKTGNTLEASRYANEIVTFMKEHNISPLKNAMMPMIQAPVFISFFMALRKMAKAPVESFKEGGILWAPDLTIPDPYYITPLVTSATLYVILKIGAESGMRMENMKWARYAMPFIPVVIFPFMMNFPSAILYYWCTTNFCTLVIVSILKIDPVRKYLNLPKHRPVDPKFQLPKKKFVAGVKEAYEDQKVLALINERRRMDTIRFQKAGTGPVPRTFSYDPTKPRPSNAAVSAKEHKT